MNALENKLDVPLVLEAQHPFAAVDALGVLLENGRHECVDLVEVQLALREDTDGGNAGEVVLLFAGLLGRGLGAVVLGTRRLATVVGVAVADIGINRGAVVRGGRCRVSLLVLQEIRIQLQSFLDRERGHAKNLVEVHD